MNILNINSEYVYWLQIEENRRWIQTMKGNEDTDEEKKYLLISKLPDQIEKEDRKMQQGDPRACNRLK